LISAGICVVAGIAFIRAMAIADFDTETTILFVVTLLLLSLSLAVFFFRLRVIVPMYLLVPFLAVVAARHVGDMGAMHFMDGSIYLIGCLAFFLALTAATIAKLVTANYRIHAPRGGEQ